MTGPIRDVPDPGSPEALRAEEKPIVYVGTIGHVDHGKSTLTSAITAVLARSTDTVFRDLDSIDHLPEERNRSVTIRNAYCEFTSPVRRYVHVDCPGHVDYVTQMVAGAHAMDVGILVVSAVEGPKPQTCEHLLIARHAGVRHVAVFLSMLDRAEDPELVELVEAEVVDLLALHGYDPAAVPVVRGSARAALQAPEDPTASACIEELVRALDSLPVQIDRSPDVPFFMPVIDAVFVPGRGMVLVGRIDQGVLAVGDEIEVLGAGPPRRARVRSIESFLRQVPVASAGDMVGLLVSGVGREDRGRGRGIVAAAPGTASPCDFFWAEIQVLPPELGGRHTPVQHGYTPLLHFRTGAVTGEMLLPKRHRRATPGERLRSRIRLGRPLVIVEGAHFLGRDGRTTVISGRVEQILSTGTAREGSHGAISRRLDVSMRP